MERHLIFFDDVYQPRKVVLLHLNNAVTQKLLRMRNCLKLVSTKKGLQTIEEVCEHLQPVHFSYFRTVSQKIYFDRLNLLYTDNIHCYQVIKKAVNDSGFVFEWTDARIQMDSTFRLRFNYVDKYGDTRRTGWYELETVLGYQIQEKKSFWKRLSLKF